MSDSPVTGWSRGMRPDHLFRRFEFGSYAQTRRFLDELAQLSESMGVAPQNIGFGTTHVNVTIAAEGQSLTDQDLLLAVRIGQLAGVQPAAAA